MANARHLSLLDQRNCPVSQNSGMELKLNRNSRAIWLTTLVRLRVYYYHIDVVKGEELSIKLQVEVARGG